MSSVVLSTILIELITCLMIFYFLNLQIEYSYQYDKSIRIDFNQVFAILSNPTGIATDNAGNVYVIDDEDDKVKKFTTNGTFVKELEIQRIKASDSSPTGIATDNAGNVYVIDDEDDKVKKFTTNGTFVKEWEIQRTDNKRQEITIVP
jgi:DNA-binding beta-propeller fold protein YncE